MRMDTPAVGACRWLRLVARSENGLLVLLLAATIVLAAVQIVRRNVFEAGLVWGEPLVRLIVLWVGLTGAVVASRIDRHIHVNVLARLLPARLQHAARVFNRCLHPLGVRRRRLARGALCRRGVSGRNRSLRWGTGVGGRVHLPAGFGVIALRYALHTHTRARMPGRCNNGSERRPAGAEGGSGVILGGLILLLLTLFGAPRLRRLRSCAPRWISR